MRHKVYGKHLSRDKNQRQALFKGLIRSLILQGSISTTEAKAKAIKGQVDKLITKAKLQTSGSLRVLESSVTQKDVYEKLTKEVVAAVGDRTSGFTQVVRLGQRAGDGAMMVKISLIGVEGKAEKGSTSDKASADKDMEKAPIEMVEAEEKVKETEKKPVKKVSKK